MNTKRNFFLLIKNCKNNSIQKKGSFPKATSYLSASALSPLLNFSKKSFTNDLKVILHLAIFYKKNNMGLEQSILQIMLY